ncbi:transcription initiation factor IIB 2 [Halomicroarcula limicola]|uniref:Transcription initiation factor IIB n=1 Tax=Haloarcula limicola TaxID=1429915 RepID=A0A8J8C4T4_9EURY|nr:TFIIB-type zinc ribbon-containing protein [Halomicroarcula limicola]MBV0926006.1 transcription initiation factor IIB 2 [Halomicroarcula limicola]
MSNPKLDTGRSDIEEQRADTEPQPPSSCPECDGQVVHDEEHGETTCEECGLVLDDISIDRGPEWRAFYTDERAEKSRVGAPTTQLMHDKGLSTTIGWQDKDAYGKSVSAQKREQLQRLRTWDERFRTKDAHERNLRQALGEIDRMASALGVPDPVRETAGALYRRAVDEHLLPGRSIEGMSTAALYAAARRHGTPRSLSEFATVSRVKEIRIQRAYRYTSRELDLRIEPADPLEYVPQFASALEVSDEAIRQARDLLRTAKAEGVHSGKSPAGLAAAAIYAATHLANEQLTQETVADAAHVSKVTIRTRYKELLEAYAADSGAV